MASGEVIRGRYKRPRKQFLNFRGRVLLTSIICLSMMGAAIAVWH